MTEFAQRAENVSISGIRQVFEAAGKDAINLGLGQPDFPTPSHVKTAAKTAIDNGQTDGYTTNKGMLGVREAISEKHARDNNLDISPENIIATAGGSEALHLAIEAHVDPGQNVIIPDPGFVSYQALTLIAGGIPTPVPLRDDLSLDPQTIEEAIDEQTAAFVVNSPSNPTGAIQTKNDMQEFARIADEHDIICITDEVYEQILYTGTHYTPMQYADSDNVVLVNACSKTYSMTGWRLGWVTASERRIERMLRIHQYIQACASAPAQYAAEAALTGPQDTVSTMVEAFAERRDIIIDALIEMGLDVPIPEGAFYVMPKVPDGWIQSVLDHGVIIVPGEAFGERGTGYARLSYAIGTDQLHEAINRMKNATNDLS